MHCNAMNGNDVVQMIEAAERFELAAFFSLAELFEIIKVLVQLHILESIFDEAEFFLSRAQWSEINFRF